MEILVPQTITDAQFTSSSIVEPDAGETAWVSGGTYALGDRRIRTTTHRIYECVLAHTGRAVLPEDDAAYWLEYRPTNKWAMLDGTVSTQSFDTDPLVFVINPGFYGGVDFYGLQGEEITFTHKDQPSGAVIYTVTEPLIEPVAGWYDWLFTPIRQRTKFQVRDLLPYANGELTVTITPRDGFAKVGLIAIGNSISLVSENGGTEYYATAEPVDYSYIATASDGTTEIRRRNYATNMRATVFLEQEDADAALLIVQQVLGTPVSATATRAAGYQGLSVFGLLSASLSYEGPTHARMQINVRGLI